MVWPTADGGTGHFDDNVLWLGDVGNGRVDDSNVLPSEPGEGFHGFSSFTDLEVRGSLCLVKTQFLHPHRCSAHTTVNKVHQIRDAQLGKRSRVSAW